MDSFSWTDSVRATVSTCLPCFASTQQDPGDSANENEGRSARRGASHYDELEGLLGDVEMDVDAETMSLHSNIGHEGADGRRKKKKKRGPKKSIRLFGYDLFGRRPIHLSESEDDEPVTLSARRQRLGRLSSAHSSSSISAFDSDASPLDAAAISQLSAQDIAARAAHEAFLHEAEEQRRREEREEKEERRRRRRERRELKRVAEALQNGAGMNMDGEEFEGFPGSGQLRSPFSAVSESVMSSPTVPNAPVEEFGPYIGGAIPPVVCGDDAAVGEADFGGEAYARKTRSRGSDSSRSRTQSQSQTSASHSNAGSSQYTHQYLSRGPPLPSPSLLSSARGFQALSPVATVGPFSEAPRRKKRSSGSQSAGKKSSSPTSQSASLQSVESPIDTSFSRRFAPSEPYIVEHNSSQAPGMLPPGPIAFDEIPQETNKFPSIGFGGVRRTNSMGTTNSGAFLARRGED
ncbi:hypothetical protein DFH11DRAFT_1583964 [Phellopilus nigrolimitatus]|nr:hypothetical protein DFH11DRAFT_1583964 [Phellopilus nigrolimitatus]